MSMKFNGPVVGVVCAMDSELALLREALSDAAEERGAGLPYYTGRIDGVDTVLCSCGVGKVNAAMHTQLLIDRYQPDILVNSGVAGALDPSLKVFDLVVGTEFVYHDMQEFVLDRFEPLQRVYPSDPALLDLFRELGIPCRFGRIASGDRFVSDRREKESILQKTGALCVEMEGTAIAHTALLNGVGCISVRAVSDAAEDGAVISFDEFEKQAAKTGAELTRRFIRRFGEKRV